MGVWGFIYDFTVYNLLFIDYELLCVAESWRLQGGALASLDAVGDAVLGSVVVFRLATGAVAEVVIPFSLAL